jgi:phosphotransferase system enzyme I (PtsP)
MRGVPAGPRILLKRLREVMAEPINAQLRLDKIVRLIAGNMVAEVCSLYVMRADSMLELFASEGLAREAVHMTTMHAGEGLVGLIAQRAEPLNLANAQAHPAFSYKPETGEEIYQSFLGVPVLRQGVMLGVLVVQNRASRLYTEEEIEALLTTAMVLAEIISSGELQSLARPGTDIAVRRPLDLSGLALAEGVGLGHVVLHQPRVVVQNLIADDPAQEKQRLEAALNALRASLDHMLERGDLAHGGEHREVLEAFRMFADDRGWTRRLTEAVMTGLTAEAAVERVQSDNRARMMRQTDAYLRERLHDLDELADRLLNQLQGRSMTRLAGELPDNAILVARSMGPAALLDYDRSRLRGLVLEEGGAQSHIAIVARAMGIPVVSMIENAVGLVEPGDEIIVDGTTGLIHIRPQPDILNTYREKARLRADRQAKFRSLRDVKAVTKDGAEIHLHLNAGLIFDLQNVVDTGADGIGLFRTELQFMVTDRLPSLAEQTALYRSVLEAADGRPVVFRTLDIGGDKILPYMAKAEEENPALGWRAIRIGLDRPGLLRAQVRALLRAAAGYDLKIMFPMVATIDEFQRARAIVHREQAFMERFGRDKPRSVQLGVMVEVPSLLFALDALAREVDFMSVGSNDLMQFLFAADRDHPQMAGRYDACNPAAIRALRMIVEAADRAQIPVSVCGELAGRPVDALMLIALGYRHLSMSPLSVGPIKAMVLDLDLGALRQRVAQALEARETEATIRPALEQWAHQHGLL